MTSRLFRTDLQTKLKKDMQEKLDRERMARDFPFHPQINEWNFSERDDVLSHLQHKEQQRQAKIAALQQQRVMELQQSVSPSPAISPYSKSLTFDQPVHLRLYSIAASRAPASPEEPEPPRSARRASSTDWAKLYEDAKVRQMHRERALQKAVEEQEQQINSKKVAGHSLTILLQKTDKEIQKITNLIWEGANSSGIITEALLADALLTVGFFKMDLQEDVGGVRAQQEVKALKKLCEYMQARRQQKQEDSEEAELQNESASSIEDGIDAADAIDFLTLILQRCAPTEENRRRNEEPPQTEEDHLVRRFLRLHQTGRAYDADRKRNANAPSEFTFHPSVNRKSMLLDAVQEKEKEKDKEAGSPSPKRYEKLYSMSTATEEKLVAMRKEKEKKGMEDCTFKPHVNRQTPQDELDGMKKSEALFNMSKAKKNKKKKEGEEDLPSHVIKELKHCSFQPNLDSTKRSLEMMKNQTANSSPPRGSDKFVDRIQQGHEEREQFKQLLERPSYPKPSALKGKPPSFLSKKQAWEPPLLYVDIKLGHGRTGRIGIHKGDDPRVLAQNFANAFHLDAKLTGKLVDMLQMHIDNLSNMEEGMEGEEGEGREGGQGEDYGNNNRYGESGDYSFNSNGTEEYA